MSGRSAARHRSAAAGRKRRWWRRSAGGCPGCPVDHSTKPPIGFGNSTLSGGRLATEDDVARDRHHGAAGRRVSLVDHWDGAPRLVRPEGPAGAVRTRREGPKRPGRSLFGEGGVASLSRDAPRAAGAAAQILDRPGLPLGMGDRAVDGVDPSDAGARHPRRPAAFDATYRRHGAPACGSGPQESAAGRAVTNPPSRVSGIANR